MWSYIQNCLFSIRLENVLNAFKTIRKYNLRNKKQFLNIIISNLINKHVFNEIKLKKLLLSEDTFIKSYSVIPYPPRSAPRPSYAIAWSQGVGRRREKVSSQHINNESANDVCSDVVAYVESCPRQVSLIRDLQNAMHRDTKSWRTLRNAIIAV